MTVLHDWDAGTYDRLGGTVQSFGHALLDRLELDGDEAVLDAGCGSGAVTAALLERLPRGRVVAVDSSPAMVERARERLGPDPRLTVQLGNLVELELPEPVDGVFSSAVFHWVPDHERLFERMHAALRPAGWLLAQCGGHGNIADVRQALERVQREPDFAERLGSWPGPWCYSPPHVACERLERAGFEAVRAMTHIERVPTREPERYLASIILGGHLDQLPEELHAPFVRRVVEEMESPQELRYVRLTLTARRATIGA
jgi:trans-aconitate 2-methyltransferase